jgi:hypothetical protein
LWELHSCRLRVYDRMHWIFDEVRYRMRPFWGT